MSDHESLDNPFFVAQSHESASHVMMHFPSPTIQPPRRPSSRPASHSSKEVLKEDPHSAGNFATATPTASPSQRDDSSPTREEALDQTNPQESPFAPGSIGIRHGLWPRLSSHEGHYLMSSAPAPPPLLIRTMSEPWAEFWGALVMVFLGTGSTAQVLLSSARQVGPGGDLGGYQSISWGWAIGMMLGLVITGDSGAYLNPAVTFTNCVLRKVPWRKLPFFVFAQLFAGFLASGLVYSIYVDDINKVEGHDIRTVPPAKHATAAVFAPYPLLDVNKATQITSQFIESAFFMFVIMALRENARAGTQGPSWPLSMGGLVFVFGIAFGSESGYTINLARDFGPRLMSYALGYGPDVWRAGGYYFWIPMVIPFIGCLLGGVVYDVCLSASPSPMHAPYFGLKALVPGFINRLRSRRTGRQRRCSSV